jgi:hypothetical protein
VVEEAVGLSMNQGLRVSMGGARLACRTITGPSRRSARIAFQAGLVAVPGRGHDDLSASALLTNSMTPPAPPRPRWDAYTIRTAVAPDAVFTVCAYGTGPLYDPQLVTMKRPAPW